MHYKTLLLVFAVADLGFIRANEVSNSNGTILVRQTTNNQCNCGIRHSEGSKIVGGVTSKLHEFPWRVALYLRRWWWSRPSYVCSATLIHNSWVMTAAHCVYNLQPSQISFSIGDHNLQSSTETKNVVRRASRIIFYPGFNPLTINGDMAVVKLESPVAYSNNISPICLPFKHLGKTFDKNKATTSGWGVTSEGSLTTTTTLRQVELDVISNAKCSQLYPGSITSNMLCTSSKGRDACQGDSGSSLDWQDPISKRYCAIGVVSFGEGCARTNKPGVFTRVSVFLSWIQKVTGETLCSS